MEWRNSDQKNHLFSSLNGEEGNIAVKLISRRRYRAGLKKEKIFWERPGILESQTFRTDRYLQYIQDVSADYGPDRIQNVLDVGCGPACLGQTIKSGKKWYLDPLLDTYREIFDTKIPDGELLSIHIENAELKSDFFDIILSFNAIDHVQDPWLALKKINNALKKAGIFLFSMYTRKKLLASLRNLQEYLHLSTDRAHPYTFTTVSIENALSKTNFKLQSREKIEDCKSRTEYIWKCTK